MQTILPRLYTLSFNKEHHFWQADANWQEPYFPGVLHYHFETELEHTAGDVNMMIQKATAMVEDLIALKQHLDTKKDVLNFLQFQASTAILSHVTQNKLFPYSFDWISNSISEQINKEVTRELSLERIDEMMMAQDPYIREFFGQIFCLWTHDLFYYSRSTGGHNELAQHYMQVYLLFFLADVVKEGTPKHAMAVAQIATWCHNHKQESQQKTCNELLNSLYKHSTDREVKKTVAFHFGVADKNDSELSKVEWCQLVLNQYGTDLRAHEKTQLVVNLYQHDVSLVLQHLDEILLTLSDYTENYEQTNVKLNEYHHSRIFSIFERLLHRLVVNSHVEEACKIMATYFRIAPNKMIKQPVLFIVPNTAEGPLYCFDKHTLHVEADPLSKIPEIVNLRNRFLGTSFTFNDDLSFVLESPLRPGVPMQEVGNPYQQRLSGYMNFKKLLEYPKLAECLGYFMLYGSQLNLQNIMSLEIGRTIPIVHSFQQQRQCAKVRRALIWEGANQYAETERLGLEEIFASNGVSVSSFRSSESSKKEFLHHYSDPDYDAVWILGHGEFPHHEAHKSYLDLGDGITVSITELRSVAVRRDECRLLVIDACDGATTSLANSPYSIGIGVSTISDSQVLMSHAWPVQNSPSTMLSLLLAIYLTAGTTYAQAHHNTITTFYQGAEASLAVLSEHCRNPNVIERIKNGNFDCKSFYCWGSFNFFV